MGKKISIAFPLIFANALALALIIAFIRPGAKYGVEIHETIAKPDNSSNRYYSDLNGDGNTECISKIQSTKHQTGLIIYHSDGSILEQFNFKGNTPIRSTIEFFDYNHDLKQECYFFSHVEDSLFLNILEPYSSDPVKRRFIELARLEDGEANYTISNMIFDDSNALDKRLVFTVAAGFALNPRTMYSYNPESDDLIKSPEAGSILKYKIHAFDIDGDGTMEYYGSSHATGNYKTPVDHSDEYAWLMIYSHRLEYEFQPVKYGAFTAQVYAFPVIRENEGHWAFVCFYRGTKKKIPDKIMLYTSGGKFVSSTDLSTLDIGNISLSYVKDNQIYIVDQYKGLIHVFNSSLKKIKTHSCKMLNNTILAGPFKIEGIKEDFILAANRNMELGLFSSNGKRLTNQSFYGYFDSTTRPGIVKNYHGFTGIYLNLADSIVLFNLHKRYRWLLFIAKISGIILLTNALVQVLQYYQKKQEQRRLAINARLREYQLIALKKQIDPHFIFNALNSILSMNLKGDIEQSEDFLLKFAGLMREALEHSDKNILPLSREIEFIQKYLLLEQSRLGNEFRYFIDIPENCRNVEIPAMSVHSFVENAIKHGLAGKQDEKILKVSARKSNSEMTVLIEDNGTGFHPGSGSSYSTGKGYDILRQMFFAFHQLTGREINYERSEPETGGVRIKLVVQTSG